MAGTTLRLGAGEEIGPSDAVFVGSGASWGWADIFGFPVRGGRAELEIVPTGTLPVTKPPLPPPTSSGGVNGPSATCVEIGLRACGIACEPPDALAGAMEPVGPLNPPRLLHPASEADPIARPAKATILSA